MKPGFRTSEFWGKTLFQITIIAAGFIGEEPPIDEATALTIAAGLEGIYTLGRSVVKFFGSN